MAPPEPAGGPGGVAPRRVMVLGTSSGVGKTLIALALCRWIRLNGGQVAPFKTMSMQLGDQAFRTRAGGEIHVHQAHQAWAAGTEPQVDMNPIMMRQRRADDQVEVMMLGRAAPDLSAMRGGDRIPLLRAQALRSYHRLSQRFDTIVMEGCGSPVELNIKHRDLSNLWVAETLDVPCILVGSVENTGLFASLVGTVALLSASERRRLRGFVVNKFHGRPLDFREGVDILQERLGLPCLGVVPFLPGLSRIGNQNHVEGAEMSAGFRAELEQWTSHVVHHLDDRLLGRCLVAGG